jgi:hypothetical protein
MPTCSIEHENRVRADGHTSAYLGQMGLHGLRIHFRHDDGSTGAPFRADCAKYVG